MMFGSMANRLGGFRPMLRGASAAPMQAAMMSPIQHQPDDETDTPAPSAAPAGPLQGIRSMFGATAPGAGGGGKRNWGEILQTLSAGLADLGDGEGPNRILALTEQRMAAQEAAAQREQMARLIDTVAGGDQRLAALMQIDPKAAAAAIAKRDFEPFQLAPGNVGFNTPMGMFYNPRIETMGDQVYALTPDSMTKLGQRDRTYGEQLDKHRLDETIRHNRATEGLGGDRLDVQRSRAMGGGGRVAAPAPVARPTVPGLPPGYRPR